MNELFAEDSPFLREETRKTRWAIPYDHECLNARADILLGRNGDALSGKRVLDAGAHMGTMAYAALQKGARFVHAVDVEEATVERGLKLFSEVGVESWRYRFEAANLADWLERVSEKSFDTALCFGVLYYVSEPFAILKALKRAVRETILLDTFTASYAMVQGKEAGRLYDSISDAALEQPLMLYALTRPQKKDYRLPETFVQDQRELSVTSFPTCALLELWFEALELDWERLDWSDHILRPCHFSDLESPEQKRASHWADVYASGMRVAYRLRLRG